MVKAKHYSFKIAGINVLFDTDVQIQGLAYKRYQPFISRDDHPDIIFRFRSKNHITPDGINPNSYIEKTPVSKTIFNFNKNKMYCHYIPAFRSEIERFRIGPSLISPFLQSFSSTIIHSSAILRNGKVAIFLAPDEGGKTTVIRTAKNGRILNDDHNIIKKINKNYFVYGTPWGMIANKLRGPVGAFFILIKAKKFKLKKIESNVLLGYLWNEHLSYNFFLPKKYSSQHFNFLTELSKAYPTYEMHFQKNNIHWDKIDEIFN